LFIQLERGGIFEDVKSSFCNGKEWKMSFLLCMFQVLVSVIIIQKFGLTKDSYVNM